MSFTPNQYKAIGLWAEKHNSVPQLSTPQAVRFKDKDTGEISAVSLLTLEVEFLKHRKEVSREKARERKDKRV